MKINIKHITFFEIALLVYFLIGCVSNEPDNEISRVSKSPAFPLRLHWKFETQEKLSTRPLYIQEMILERSDIRGTLKDTFLAIDANTGELLWEYETDGEIGFFDYLIGATTEHLILAGNERVVAINIKTGQLSWIATGFIGISSIATNEETIYVSAKYQAVALDANSGAVKWKNTSFPGYSFSILYDDVNDTIIIPADQFYLLAPSTGALLSAVSIDSFSALSNCRFLQLHKNRLYCEGTVFDTKTGQLLSVNDFDENDYLWFPLIKSDTMYLRTNFGTVKAIDIKSMTQKWEYIPQKNSMGEIPEIISNISVLGTTGYAIADDATLRAFDIFSGNEIGWWQSSYVADWRTGTQVYVTIPGVATNDSSQLYVTFGDNTLYAFGP